ncbi:YIP1 family protein [Paenibacillus sp. J5C_2022]|uniref:YIP1 family protein n=1 Tax=Paenibacillus sp. J5C2022 TaxID=2977129 RepID=UPI0021D0E9E6|nr:YIP1 family protein [Paenibacillus sp. J5C2022]MCU6710926.1 YIP1 family protein [Paenibacillus sp. J5C2022]
MKSQTYKAVRRWAQILGIAALVFLLLPSSKAAAELPYRTYTANSDGKWMRMPHAYVPVTTYQGFNSPEGLFMTTDDELYVADTGNDRIVHLSKDGSVQRVIPSEHNQDSKSQLRRPEGVFVTEEGDIYVADTGSRRIVKFDSQGQFATEFRSPQSDLIPTTFAFIPSKLVLDHRGYLYIATKGGYQGLLQLDQEGQFVGFFGANKVSRTWLENFKQKFYTEEQLKQEQARLPGAITNATVDEKGFIYTVNQGMKAGQLRRLNFAGIDLFRNNNFAPWIGPNEKFSFIDVDVSKEGFISAIEATNGEIYQYDSSGHLLLLFGSIHSSEERLGSFKRPTSVVTNSNGDMFVADGELNLIQVFKQTEYGETLHRALDLYQRGQYEAGRELWEEVRAMNGLLDRAHQGIAKAEYQYGRFAAALDYFEFSKDREGYSQAFWELRMSWLIENFGWIMTVIVSLWFCYFIAIKARKYFNYSGRKKNISNREDSNHWRSIIKVLKHPVKTMSELSEQHETKPWTAIVLLVGSFGCYMAGKAVVSYPFAKEDFQTLDFKIEALQFFLLWFVWLIASYLIGSIMKGEAPFKRLFIIHSYAMVPLVLFHLPVQILSNALTLQEDIIYQAANYAIYGWMGLLFFIGLQTAQNYNLKEALGVTAVSLFAAICILLFGFVGVGLVYQGIDFFWSFGREVLERV